MGPLDGTLGDVPCVHLSRCTKRSGMFSIHGKTSNPGDGSVGLVRGVAERRWPPSFSPTELLWKTTGSCLMMLGAGSGIGCLLCCQLSGTRACWGTDPSPPYQGPRHLWLGTEAPPSCQLCGCSDHGEGVVHAGSAVPILVPPRMAATWPVPPLCQGPRHLQEGAHVPVWGVCAPSRPFRPYQAPRHLRPPGG